MKVHREVKGQTQLLSSTHEHGHECEESSYTNLWHTWSSAQFYAYTHQVNTSDINISNHCIPSRLTRFKALVYQRLVTEAPT